MAPKAAGTAPLRAGASHWSARNCGPIAKRMTQRSRAQGWSVAEGHGEGTRLPQRPREARRAAGRGSCAAVREGSGLPAES